MAVAGSYSGTISATTPGVIGTYTLPVTVTVSSGGIGYMIGYGGGATEGDIPTVEAWLGRPVNLITDSTNTMGTYRTGFTSTNGKAVRRIIAVPMLSINGDKSPILNDMALAANGTYNTQYTTMLTSILNNAPVVAIRPGWEGPGGFWYPWSVGFTNAPTGTQYLNQSYANFIGAFKRIATIARSIQPGVLLDWCGAWGSGTDILSYWPGAYNATTNPGGADVVSLDFYEAAIAKWNNNGMQPTWAMTQSFTGLTNPPSTGGWSLDDLTAFATAQGVKVGMPEYGPGSAAMYNNASGGEGSGVSSDDSAWITGNIAWINSLGSQFLYSVWSPWQPADDMLSGGAASVSPKEQAAIVKAWGTTHFDRTVSGWYSGPATPSEIGP